ncbi:hypothetical protein ACWELV_29305 [Streptomyces mirabilis]
MTATAAAMNPDTRTAHQLAATERASAIIRRHRSAPDGFLAALVARRFEAHPKDQWDLCRRSWDEEEALLVVFVGDLGPL